MEKVKISMITGRGGPSLTGPKKLPLAEVIETAIEKERSRFSAELHDGVGSILVAMKLYLDSLESCVLPGSGKKIEVIRKLLEQAKTEIRNFSHNLSAKVIRAKGLIQSLRDLADCLNQTERVKANFCLPEKMKILSAEKELAIFRIIQEQITNSMKHGCAGEINIEVRTLAAFIEVEYRDNGNGFDLNQPGKNKNGLNNIIERAESHKGKIQIQSRPGSGYWSLLTVPFRGTETRNSEKYSIAS
jgi:signal transduction histidine kinase